jgi:hypothetical protein
VAFSTPTRVALGLGVSAALFAGTLELAARALLASPAAHYRLNNGGPEARKLVSIDAARRLGDRGRIHIGDVDPDPDLGWALQANAQNTVDGLTTDADRHRLTRPPDRVIAPDAPKVWLLGDSFTLGLEVRDEQSWAWGLQARTAANVVNGGVHGYGLDQAVLHFERDGAKERPALVILGKSDPLLLRISLTWDAWAKPWFTLIRGLLFVHGQPTPTPAEAIAAAPFSRAVEMLPVLRETYAGRRGGVFSPELAGALFQRLHADVTEAGGRLVVLQMPATVSIGPAGELHQDMATFQAWCADTSVICVDASPAVHAAYEAHEPLTAGVHWSPEVNARVAALLADTLIGAGLIPPITTATPN